MEQSVQSLLRVLGGSVMGRLSEASVARHETARPDCPRCGRSMRLVEKGRGRQMRGLVGDFAFPAPITSAAVAAAASRRTMNGWVLARSATRPPSAAWRR